MRASILNCLALALALAACSDAGGGAEPLLDAGFVDPSADTSESPDAADVELDSSAQDGAGPAPDDAMAPEPDAMDPEPDAMDPEPDAMDPEPDAMDPEPDAMDPEPDAPEPDGTPDTAPLFNDALFKATHNSYSGEERGSLTAQLDEGVRFFELDLHDNDFLASRDYRVGHDAPGDETLLGGGNPATSLLSAWLELLDRWSDRHPDHGPITVCLDIKDNLMDNHSFALGNLAALNERLRQVFGDKLVRPDEVEEAWPRVEALRGRFIAVLSGDQGTRMGYRWDVGANPAVAMNEEGQVVEVHDSGTGTLWYWTGQMEFNGRVTWHRHGRYDTGADPAVAINNDGWIVEVHKSERTSTLWSRVGRLDDAYEIQWSDSVQYDDGVLPTVRFEDLEGMTVREVHKSQNNDQNWTWTGTARTDFTLAWGGHGRTADPRFDESEQVVGRRMVSVRAGTDSVTPSNALLLDTHISSGSRIRYAQVAFVEFQRGGDGRLDRDGLWFYTARASDRDWSGLQRARGKIVRQWGFNSPGDAAEPPANFPATDHPFDEWYRSYTSSIGVVEY